MHGAWKMNLSLSRKLYSSCRGRRRRLRVGVLAGRDVWCQNLGPTAKVAEVLSQWLGSIDYDEREAAA